MTSLSRHSSQYLWATRTAVAMCSITMFLILVKLGFWQLDRAEMKERWQAELTHRQLSAPLTYAQLVSFPPQSKSQVTVSRSWHLLHRVKYSYWITRSLEEGLAI
ncbi:SURF1 family cytochrome oxidase biogenesis protein [Shewanella psychropiezotolerans]|uniref:SURF1 family cytochrome oxidase biogenesis protein n=1 Tax=Shewanella psychropiezotolerans TaxID=2593655 RepID=UPI0022771005|nr:SURF1 family cytochrome oxidase biogenesis protein [Shewanella psychropiezotolerans]